jgi:ABC-type polysaccharide/polyol phosphate transport system ATPase subunit
VTTAIRFDDVTKTYRVSGEDYRALRDDLTRVFTRKARTGVRQDVTALRNVSFEIKPGEAVALIGENGAGKSTALKVVSRISYPTFGRVTVKGRVGALIEVGSGLHPELTGRENVQLYGRILGLPGRYVRARFDEIVEFAGLSNSIDRPVKQFSSGMQLRLGFSIAAHLEPDVLIVDEALSVGDAAFQHRCVERMSNLVREGRTLLFVTHHLGAAEALCDRALLLTAGKLDMDGHPKDVIHEYLRRVHSDLVTESRGRRIAGNGIEIMEVTTHDAIGREVSSIRPGDALTVRVRYHASRPVASPQFSIALSDPTLGHLAKASMLVDGEDVGTIQGDGCVECAFHAVPFKPRTYDIVGEVREGFGRLIDFQRWARIQVEDEVQLHGSGAAAVSGSLRGAPVVLPYSWRYPRTNGGVPLGREEKAGSAVGEELS